MTRRARIPALFALAATCAGVSACGGDDAGDPIPAGKATRLAERIDAVERSVEGDCTGIASRIRAVQVTVASLDEDGVGGDVQDALADGVENLRDLAARECAARPDDEPQTTPETIPETVPTTPEPTIPEPTTPEPTTPEPTTPEPTTPEPLPPEEPPDEGDGAAQFNPNGKTPPGREKKDGE